MNAPTFVAAYNEICMSISRSRLGRVMNTVADMAEMGSDKHAKLFLEAHNIIGRGRAVKDVEPEKPRETAEELLAKKHAIEKELKKTVKKEMEESGKIFDADYKVE